MDRCGLDCRNRGGCGLDMGEIVSDIKLSELIAETGARLDIAASGIDPLPKTCDEEARYYRAVLAVLVGMPPVADNLEPYRFLLTRCRPIFDIM